MELIKAIDERMSIRSFLDKEVGDDLVYKILECGHKAPTAGNIQPWEFIVVRKDEVKRDIVKTTFVGNDEKSEKTQEWMLTAPVFIVVLGDAGRCRARYGEMADKSLIYLDCSACIENMLLSVVDLGLASCYISGFREMELKQVLNLPEDIIPVAVLPIGYPKIVPQRRQKKGLCQVVNYEYYGNKKL